MKLGSVVVGVSGRVSDRVPFNGQLLPVLLACGIGGFPGLLLAFERLEAKDFGSTGHDRIVRAGSNGNLIQRNTGKISLTRIDREKVPVIVSGGVRLLDANPAEALAAT